MKVTVSGLAASLKAELVRGDGARVLEGVASLKDAGPQHLAPYLDSAYAEQLQATQAGAILAKSAELAAGAPAGAAVLCVPDPEIALIGVLNALYPPHREAPGVDARAAVEPGAQLGEGVYVGPFAVVRSGAVLGAGCTIHAHAVVGRNAVLGPGCTVHSHAALYEGVTLGARVTVHSGAVIGADGFGYKLRNGKHVKVPQVGTVTVGDDVEIGANTCIDRGALSHTTVGAGTKIDNLVQVGHNVTIGNHCILCGQVAIAGSSVLEDYVVLGGNAGIADHVRMGRGSKAGAKTGVGKDVPPGTEVWGLFAEERKQAFRQLAAYRRLPELEKRVKELERALGVKRGGAAEA
jgi:UDP-3-O-[3-hydroxymyristoyl] glucosamine N-acyltransferase